MGEVFSVLCQYGCRTDQRGEENHGHGPRAPQEGHALRMTRRTHTYSLQLAAAKHCASEQCIARAPTAVVRFRGNPEDRILTY